MSFESAVTDFILSFDGSNGAGNIFLNPDQVAVSTNYKIQ